MPPTPPTIDRPVPLSSLRRGARGWVHQRLADARDGDLLIAMGLSHRSPIRVCRAGEPCIVQVASSRLALSAALARQIFVIPSEATC